MIALPGGSKLFTYDVGPCGVVAQYATQQVRIRNLLQRMYDAGQRSLGLVLQCAPEPTGDGLTLPSDDYSWFQDALMLIEDARNYGFQFVAPEFVYAMGDDAVRNWKTFDNIAASRIWNLLYHFHEEVMMKCGLPFRMDLGGEWPTPAPGSLAVQLSQLIWTNYTAVFWPNAVPCLDATISIPARPDSVPLMVQSFCGNPPACLDLHIYNGGVFYPDAASCLTGMKHELAKVGLDHLPIDIGETLFNNPACARSTAQGIVQNRISVQRIYQWQTTDGSPISVADVSPYDAWKSVGA